MTICFENYEIGHFETYNHCGYSIPPSDYYPFEQITLFGNF